MEKYFPFVIITSSCLISLIPHISNFSPVYAAVNYGFVTIKNSFLATFSILAMLYISNILLKFIYNTPESEIYSFYGWWILYVYSTHIINGVVSKLIIKKPDQFVNIGVTCTLTSLNFFMLSNFGYFVFSQNDHTVAGLRKTYLDAIPFFPMQVLACFVFSMIFFGLHTFLARREQSVMNENSKTSDINNATSENLLVNGESTRA